MEQYPTPYDYDGQNYSYQYGIYLDCDPKSKYVRAYDESTRAVRFRDCECGGGCESEIPPSKSQKEDDKNTPPVPANQVITQPPPQSNKATFAPSRYDYERFSNDMDLPQLVKSDKINVVIVVLLACIVVILLFNTTNGRRSKIQYVMIPQQQGFPYQMMGGQPYALPTQ